MCSLFNGNIWGYLMKNRKFWSWSVQLRKTTTTLFILLLAAGFFLGLFLGGFLWSLIFTVITADIGIFIFGTTMVFLDMADDIADIKKQLNGASGSVASPEKSPVPEATAPAPKSDSTRDGWLCKECKKVNPKHVTICSCGNPRY